MSQVKYRAFVVPSIVDDYTPITGLVNADFTKKVFLDDVEQGTAPTITEITAGYYSFSYTFPTAGSWTIMVEHAAQTFRTTWDFDIDLLTIDDERPKALT